MRIEEKSECIETTLTELLAAIDAVTETDDESFAVLASLLDHWRISLVSEHSARAA